MVAEIPLYDQRRPTQTDPSRASYNYTLEIVNDLIPKINGAMPDGPPPFASEWATPEDYGAEGDGVTDDTQAIEDALASGKPVFFGAHTYLVTTVVVPPHDHPNEGIRMMGSGTRTVIMQAATSGADHVFAFGEGGGENSTSYLIMEAFNIQAAAAKSAGAGIYMEGTAWCILRDIYMTDGNLYDGIYIYYNGNTVIEHFIAFSLHGSGLVAARGAGLTVTGGTVIQTPAGNGMWFGGDMGGVWIDQTYINGAGVYGVVFDKSIYNLLNREAYFGFNAVIEAATLDCVHVSLEGVHVLGMYGSYVGGSVNANGIYSAGYNGSYIFDGVDIYNCDASGIALEDFNGFTKIIGSRITACDNGVSLDPGVGNTAQMVIVGNDFSDNTTYGLVQSTQPAISTIVGNIAQGNGTANSLNIGNDAEHVVSDNVGISPEWTSFTPTITAGTGTFTSVAGSGQFTQQGKKVFVSTTVTITTNGTAAGYILASLPVTPRGGGVINFLVGKLTATTGNAVTGAVNSSGCTIMKYDGTYPGADATTIVLSGVYEAA